MKRLKKNHNTLLSIDRETRPKIDLVSEKRRWNLKVTVDEVFKDYIARHGLDDKTRPEQAACG